MGKVLVLSAQYVEARTAVEEVFECFKLGVEGKWVLVKPNALNEREPETGSNTHPSILRAVIGALEARGAQVIVGDNPGQVNYGRMREVFAANGLGEVAGDRLRSLGLDLIARRVPSLRFDLFFPKVLFEVDFVVNVPKLKVHSGAGFTGAVKNTFGHLPGAQKAACHVASPNRRAFERVLSDIYRLRRPDLNIMDAVLAVEGRAQGGPSLRYLGRVLASDSAPALDVVASSMIGLDPQKLHHIVDAALVDGVTPDPRAQEILGDYEPVGDFRLPKGFEPGGTRPDEKPGASLLESATRKALAVKEGLCNGCGDCTRQCPLGALGLEGGTPVIDPMRCVSCFACVEACSSRAIDLDPTYPISADD